MEKLEAVLLQSMNVCFFHETLFHFEELIDEMVVCELCDIAHATFHSIEGRFFQLELTQDEIGLKIMIDTCIARAEDHIVYAQRESLQNKETRRHHTLSLSQHANTLRFFRVFAYEFHREHSIAIVTQFILIQQNFIEEQDRLLLSQSCKRQLLVARFKRESLAIKRAAMLARVGPIVVLV
jgi:hypothetical protein